MWIFTDSPADLATDEVLPGDCKSVKIFAKFCPFRTFPELIWFLPSIFENEEGETNNSFDAKVLEFQNERQNSFFHFGIFRALWIFAVFRLQDKRPGAPGPELRAQSPEPRVQSPEPRCHPGLQHKGKDEGGHARGKSRCDQFSAVISLVL